MAETSEEILRTGTGPSERENPRAARVEGRAE